MASFYFNTIHHSKEALPSTPIVFVDTIDELLSICESWRIKANLSTLNFLNAVAATPPSKLRAPYGFVDQTPFARSVLGGGQLILGIDLEGRDLGWEGTVDVLAIYDVHANTTFLFDICVLQKEAFTEGPNGEWSLKELIEIGGGRGGNILFLVYDVRMDAAALFHLYEVRLGGNPVIADSQSQGKGVLVPRFGGVYDLQVAGTMLSGSHYLNGLAKALANHMTQRDIQVTAIGREFFAPEKGGDYERWAVRPLPNELIEYCAVTIRYYGRLLDELAVTAYGASIDTVMNVTESRLSKQVTTKSPKQRNGLRDF